MRTTDDEKTKTITIRVDEELYWQLNHIAQYNDMTVSQLVRDVLTEYIADLRKG